MKTKEEILKEWDKHNIFSKTYTELAMMAMTEHGLQCQENMQNNIDELVEFIDRQISESNFINEGDRFEAYELIKKYKDNDSKGN